MNKSISIIGSGFSSLSAACYLAKQGNRVAVYEKNNQFGGAISAIPVSKQKKIKHAVTFYLQQQGLNEYNTACRIDVIALEGDMNQPKITWVKNAF